MRLWRDRHLLKKPNSRSGAGQENAKLLAFLQSNGINSMQELYEKVSAMNKDYYDLRGQIVGAERRLAVLDKRLEMWAQYEKYKPIRQKLDKVKPGKREKYQREHKAEFPSFFLENSIISTRRMLWRCKTILFLLLTRLFQALAMVGLYVFGIVCGILYAETIRIKFRHPGIEVDKSLS